MSDRGEYRNRSSSNQARPGKRTSDQRTGRRRAEGSDGRKRIPPPPGSNDRSQRRGVDTSHGEPGAEWESSQIVVERVDGDEVNQPRSRTRKRRRRSIAVDGVDMGAVAPGTAAKLQGRLADAAAAFEAERFTEAEQLLTSIRRLAPNVPEVHELLGLTYYRLGRWQRAITQLERFHTLAQSVEQHPVLADCYRALRRWDEVDRLWDELGQASPSPELVEEGRIVAAGALADRGRLADAIRFLERAPKVKAKPKHHHLRRWYAAADLYERAGDTARARRLFARIAGADPHFGDAAQRASEL